MFRAFYFVIYFLHMTQYYELQERLRALEEVLNRMDETEDVQQAKTILNDLFLCYEDLHKTKDELEIALKKLQDTLYRR